jgi:short-subunit dehydrogenase
MATTALITGASGGIGLELARICAEHKFDLVLVARNEHKLDALASELQGSYGISVFVFASDLSQPEASKAIFERCESQGLIIDILINNAGFGDFAFFSDCHWEKQQQMIQVNITALTQLTRLFLPAMIGRKQGRILNLASTAAFLPGPGMSVYFATKAYVLSFSEAIANELARTGVTVTVLCPGPTESGFQQAAAQQESKLVKGKKLPTSRQVAAFGFRALMRGKVVAIHGWKNAMMVSSLRISPRSLIRQVSRRLMDKGH